MLTFFKPFCSFYNYIMNIVQYYGVYYNVVMRFKLVNCTDNYDSAFIYNRVTGSLVSNRYVKNLSFIQVLRFYGHVKNRNIF